MLAFAIGAAKTEIIYNYQDYKAHVKHMEDTYTYIRKDTAEPGS